MFLWQPCFPPHTYFETQRNYKYQHKANILANHFAKISAANYTQQFTANQHRTLPTLHKAVSETLPKDVRLNANFSLSELKFAIKSTRSTSPGADSICYEMFKHMSDTSLQVLLSLYNSIWNSGVIPQSWSHSLVVPIPKLNKLSYLPSSYRPILLTSNACKLMEKMIVRRLKWYLEYNNFLDIKQSGFRERRRTTDHILSLHDAVQKSLANKHHLLAIFIDLEKAYDMANKNVLLLKLLKLDINGNTFNFVRAFSGSNRVASFNNKTF